MAVKVREGGDLPKSISEKEQLELETFFEFWNLNGLKANFTIFCKK